MVNDYVTKEDCDKKMDKLEEIIAQQTIRTTVMETKFDMVMKIMSVIAVATITSAIATVFGMFL